LLLLLLLLLLLVSRLLLSSVRRDRHRETEPVYERSGRIRHQS
jgi:hypothetical protein